MSNLERAAARLSVLMARVGGVFLLLAALLVVLEVTLRFTGVAALSLGTELSSYALAVGTSWALAYVVFERAHVRVDVVSQRLPIGPRAAVDVLAVASLFVVGAVLSFGAYGTLMTSIRLATSANTTLGTPIAFPQALWTFGLVWFTCIAGLRTALALRALLRRDLAQTFRIAGSPSSDEEVDLAVAEAKQQIG